MFANDKQKVLDWLPACYFHKRDVVFVDAGTFYDWALKFVKQIEDYSPNGQSVLLIMDSYAAHTGYKTLIGVF